MMEITLFMRSLTAVLFLLMILSVGCIVPVAAGEIVKTGMVFEVLGPDEISGIEKAPPVEETVTQGETDYYTHYVSTSDTKLEISLTWDRSTGNDLDLIIVPPNGSATCIHDQNDGRTDGKIAVRTGLQQGADTRWRVGVEGAAVTGSQQYTLIINSYA